MAAGLTISRPLPGEGPGGVREADEGGGAAMIEEPFGLGTGEGSPPPPPADLGEGSGEEVAEVGGVEAGGCEEGGGSGADDGPWWCCCPGGGSGG